VIGKSHVDNATLGWCHRLETVCTTARTNPTRHATSKSTQHLNPAFSVVFDIDNNVGFAAQLSIRNHSNEELKRLKRFAAAAN